MRWRSAAASRVQQIWGLAPRLPQAYVVAESIKTAADLKGKRLSATGGGVGGFNWLLGREVLKSAGLTVNDAQFIPSATAARLPALIAGQIDGVALHPEDVYLAQKEKRGLHVLVKLADLLPEYMFNAYGAATDWIARDHALMLDTVAAMIEANRTIYRDEDKVVPIMMKATGKPKEAVEYAWEVETKHCVWSVNDGFSAKRTQWTIDNDVANGDIDRRRSRPSSRSSTQSPRRRSPPAGGESAMHGVSRRGADPPAWPAASLPCNNADSAWRS